MFEIQRLFRYLEIFVIGNSIISKIIWIVIILTFTGVGIMFLTENTIEYINSRLVTTVESSSAPLKVTKFCC